MIRKIATAATGGTVTTTDYIDGFVYVNGTLSYFPMPEGRMVNENGHLKPQYVVTDQQGNARITFDNTGPGNTAKVIQENSYYGFGMVMPGSAVTTLPTPPNKNLYNGQSEIQNDFNNLPDLMQTFYRNYDAALGRWTGVDPQTDAAHSLTVYQYAGNNPIMGNDPLGNLANEGQQMAIDPNAWANAQNSQALNEAQSYVNAFNQWFEEGAGGNGGYGGENINGFVFGSPPASQGTSSIPAGAVNIYKAGSDDVSVSPYIADRVINGGNLDVRFSLKLPEVSIQQLNSGNLPSWWGNNQSFIDGDKTITGNTTLSNGDGFSFGRYNGTWKDLARDAGNSPLGRAIVPDMISVNVNAAAVLGVLGGGISHEVHLVTRGPDAGIYSSHTINAEFGLMFDLSAGISSSSYLGRVEDIRYSDYLGNSVGISGKLLGGASGSLSFDRSGVSWITTGYSEGFSGGLALSGGYTYNDMQSKFK